MRVVVDTTEAFPYFSESALTLLDIYRAVGEPSVFAVGPACDMPGCLIEQAVNTTLKDVFAEAEQLLLTRFAGVTLANIAKDFPAALQGYGQRCD